MYFLNVWLHILAAAVWVGGLIYTAAVAVPFALTHSEEERQRILRGLGRRFRWIGWSSVAVLIITGVGNLVLRLTPIKFSQILNGDVFNPDKVERLIAIWLPWKLMLVVVMIESPIGVANAYDIARVEGIDVVIIGNNDMSSFSGYPQTDDRYQALITKVHDETLKAGKIFGQANAVFHQDFNEAEVVVKLPGPSLKVRRAIRILAPADTGEHGSDKRQ